MKAQLSFFHDNGKFEATHEIEIPDGAHTMTVQTRGACNTLPAMHIPIPRPKVKVKKWEWIVGYTHRAKMVWEHKYCTEDEIKDHAPGADWYHKIDETEIEVEE